jgi:uncharacterized damage-inducible protein DinB
VSGIRLTLVVPATTKGTDMTTDTATIVERERTDLVDTLAKHRGFLRFTVKGLSDEQAAAHPTVSALCLGGLIKHVTEVESGWLDFILNGPAAMTRNFDEWTADSIADDWKSRFQMTPDDSLAGLLEQYDEVARRTDEGVATLPDLDDGHPLPEAPWFEKGGYWSARRVLLHIIAETAQHAGHADIIRETLDGSKTMG